MTAPLSTKNQQLKNQKTVPPTVRRKSLIQPTRRRFLQGAATLSGLALSGCGWTLGKVSGSPTNSESSGDKNLLYIYTWTGYIDDTLIKRFSNETGIKVVVDVYGSNEEMLAKLQASGGQTSYSVIYPSDYFVSQMVELGLVRDLDHSRLKGIENLFSRFQNLPADPKLRYCVPLAWGTTSLIYNSEKLSTPPQDWNYIWDYKQQLNKRMTLLDDLREVFGATLKMLGYSYNSTNPEHLKQAYEKLTELKPAIASFTSDAWQTQVLTGDLLLAMCYSSDANKIIRENDKLKYVIPSSGSSVWIDTLVIPKLAPNAEAGYAWINFMLQPDVAAEVCERLSFATPNQAAYNQLAPRTRNNQGLFPPDSVLEKCESIAQVGDFASVYDSYWTKLRSS